MQTLGGAVFETALGFVGVAFSEVGLRHVTFPRRSRRETLRDLEDLGVFGPADPVEAARVQALVETFAEAKPADFSGLQCDFRGYPEFWVAVWQALRQVKWGETVTYGEAAALAGRPRAARAAGAAVAHNPLSFVIPCHRVLASNGLGGYGGEERYKEMLLRREGSWPPARKRTSDTVPADFDQGR